MFEVISEFRGRYGFLSNFYASPVHFQGIDYPTVEHGFQAMKSRTISVRRDIADLAAPAAAKKAGRSLPRRRDWEEVKVAYMEELLRLKFSIPMLRKKLLATEYAILIEGNTWGDRFWGQSPVGEGENMLGLLLMKVRAEIRLGE